MTAAFSRPVRMSPLPRVSRNVAIAGGVLLFHAAALWAIQSGMARKVVEVVIPIDMLSEMIAPAKPVAPPPPPPPQPRPVQKQKAIAPQPLAIRDPVPTPNAPTGVIDPPPAPAPPSPAPTPPAPPAPAAPPAPPVQRQVEVGASDIRYIREPNLVYPSISKRLGESGKVVLGVYFSGAGFPKRTVVEKSSGFERLDRAAQDAVMQSQITPIRRPGVTAETEILFHAPFAFGMSAN